MGRRGSLEHKGAQGSWLNFKDNLFKAKANDQTNAHKVEQNCRKPARLGREFLTGLKRKEGAHGGVSRDGLPSRNSTTVPRHASMKLGKSKLSWNQT